MNIILNTDRLIIRPITAADAAQVHVYASDPENCRYMLYLPNKSIDDTRAFIDNAAAQWQKDAPDYYEFVVTLDERVIGGMCLYPDDACAEAELGWVFNPQFQKKGYALEAAKAVKAFAINELHVTKLIAHCDSRNIPSYRLMERIGMSFAAMGKRTYSDDRGQAEEYMYSCCR